MSDKAGKAGKAGKGDKAEDAGALQVGSSCAAAAPDAARPAQLAATRCS